MAKGKLSMTEKYAIQGMLHDKVEVAEIAKNLGRTEKAIDKYVQELDSIHSTVAEVQAEKVKEDPVPAAPNKPTAPEVIDKAIKLLVAAGQTQSDANKLVNQALKTYFANTGTDNPDKLMSFALRFIKAGELMHKTTVGGSEGVTIMTGAASERGDISKKKTRGSSKVRNNVHTLKG